MDTDHPAVSDPAIEPESGDSYKVLFERLLIVHLDLLRQLREVLDQTASRPALPRG